MDEDGIAQALDGYRASQGRYGELGEQLLHLLVSLCDGSGIALAGKETRPKELPRLESKLREKSYRELADVPDLCGVRLVAFYLDDVERIGDLIESNLDVVEAVHHGGRDVDQFGYQSDHYVVRLDSGRAKLPEWSAYDGLLAEVQVRTILQHAWAVISHKLDYRSEAAVPSATRRSLFRVSALLESGDELFTRFRHDIESLRGEYAGTRDSQAGWRALELNSDSLDVVKDKLPWASVEAVAKELGWREFENYDAMPDDLLAVARAAGLSSIGDLYDLLARIVKHEFDLPLDQVNRLAELNGLTPAAIPYHVAEVAIGLAYPESLQMVRFRPPIMAAILAVADIGDERRRGYAENLRETGRIAKSGAFTGDGQQYKELRDVSLGDLGGDGS